MKDSNEIMNLCGVRIRTLRRAKKIKQRDLARLVTERGTPLSRLMVVRIERQERIVTDIELLCIADVLGVSVRDLMLGIHTEGEVNAHMRQFGKSKEHSDYILGTKAAKAAEKRAKYGF